jgi:hypothetical protein
MNQTKWRSSYALISYELYLMLVIEIQTFARRKLATRLVNSVREERHYMFLLERFRPLGVVTIPWVAIFNMFLPKRFRPSGEAVLALIDIVSMFLPVRFRLPGEVTMLPILSIDSMLLPARCRLPGVVIIASVAICHVLEQHYCSSK